jgi:hypothetical protein
MQDIISLLTVIDCESIIGNTKISPGTVTNPAPLGISEQSLAFAYMFTERSYVFNNNPNNGIQQTELKITAAKGDAVRWSITSIDHGLSYNAILQNITAAPLSALSKPENQQAEIEQYIGPPQPVHHHLKNPLVSVKYFDYIFDATVLNKYFGNKTLFTVSFYIADNLGNILGYYYWNLFVVVQPKK